MGTETGLRNCGFTFEVSQMSCRKNVLWVHSSGRHSRVRESILSVHFFGTANGFSRKNFEGLFYRHYIQV